MSTKKIDNEAIDNEILSLLFTKAPNGVRILKVYELLVDIPEKQIDQSIERLARDKKVVVTKRPSHGAKQYPAIQNELARRTAISLPDYPSNMPIKGDYKIGKASVVRLLSGDIVSGEDINEVTEALKEYADNLDKRFDERVRGEAAKIYKQMIAIFGVFVSIFALIVISTEKMLRFDVATLQLMNPFELFIKSAALFLPVGIIIFGLVWFTSANAKK